MPEWVKRLERLNELLERLAVQQEHAGGTGEEESCPT